MTRRERLLTRRDFCNSVSAMAAPVAWTGFRSATSTPLERSNRFLSIGFNSETGVGYVEEKSSGEFWEWHVNEIVAASADSFPVQMGRGSLSDPTLHLQKVKIDAVKELEGGFQLRCTHPGGRFCCGVRLEATTPEVVFSFEPDLRQPFQLAAVRFPGTVRPRQKATLVDGLEGRKSLELITALYESIETGADVQLRFKPRKCRLGLAG